MLVVSNIDLNQNVPTITPSKFLESAFKGFTLNLTNDYRYLKTAYYVSVYAEILGNPVVPSSKDIIDASRTPILLLKAEKAGIPTLPRITTDKIKEITEALQFPLVVFAVNPFSYDGYKIAKNRSALYRAVKSLGINYKFAVCVQPLIGEIISFKSVFGKCRLDQDLQNVARKVYEVFKIPMCRLHVQLKNSTVYLCGLQPLRREDILDEDLETISEEVSALSKMVNPVG